MRQVDHHLGDVVQAGGLGDHVKLVQRDAVGHVQAWVQAGLCNIVKTFGDGLCSYCCWCSHGVNMFPEAVRRPGERGDQ